MKRRKGLAVVSLAKRQRIAAAGGRAKAAKLKREREQQGAAQPATQEGNVRQMD